MAQDGPKMAHGGHKIARDRFKMAPLAEGKAETGNWVALGCFGLLWAALAYFRLQWAA